MKFKKAISVFLAVIAVASTCIVTASAKTARTNTYYVYQEMSYGELTLTSKTLVSLTYCELARAGKIVKANYVATANGKLTSLSVHKQVEIITLIVSIVVPIPVQTMLKHLYQHRTGFL